MSWCAPSPTRSPATGRSTCRTPASPGWPGKVRITRGENQLNGSEAEVNMKTGISRLLAGNAGRVQGLVVPNDQTNQRSPRPCGTGRGDSMGRRPWGKAAGRGATRLATANAGRRGNAATQAPPA